MILLMIALFGLTIPNGNLIHYLFTEFSHLGDLFHNRLALAFIIDAFLTTGLCGYFFAVKPIGKVKWQWLIIFSLIGGLGFGLPFYWWLNQKKQ